MKKLLITVFILSLISCAEQTKPRYVLDDSPLRQYQGGDQISYQTLDTSTASDSNTLGDITLNFSSTIEDYSTTSVETIRETYRSNQAFTPPFVERHLSYNDDGDLELVAFSTNGEIFWLTEDGALSSHVIYFKKVDDIPQNYTETKTLQTCDDTSNVCQTSGLVDVSYSFDKQAEVETPFAYFDALIINTEIDINFASTTTNKIFNLVGTEWIYPPLGIVKFEYQILNDQQNVEIEGRLSHTNIKLPDNLRQSN